MSKSIFISHAVKDKNVADMIVDLLVTGVGIDSNNIFCSSLEGLSIPSGANFVDFIKRQIEKPKVVILLITKNYYESTFCLCELGASWALSHKTIPIVVEPLKFKDLKSVLTGIQARRISNKSDLSEIQDELINSLNIKGNPVARWEAKRDKFLENIEDILPIESDNKFIPLDEYDDVLKNYEEAKEEISKLFEEIEKKDDLIESLKNAKDKEAVKSILQEELESIERFEKLKKEAKDALSEIPPIVCEAIYHYYREENLRWPGWGNDYLIDEINDAIKNDYLIDHEEAGVSIVADDPKISHALEALNELESFTNSIEEDDPEFIPYYTNTYDHRLNFESKRFWDTHIL